MDIVQTNLIGPRSIATNYRCIMADIPKTRINNPDMTNFCDAAEQTL